MYSRYDPPAGRLRIPDHYGGSAFREGKRVALPDEESRPHPGVARPTPPPTPPAPPPSPPAPKPPTHAPIGFPFGHGLGLEELFLIGMILLLSQSEGNNDMILLLSLLLFWGEK